MEFNASPDIPVLPSGQQRQFNPHGSEHALPQRQRCLLLDKINKGLRKNCDLSYNK